MARNTYRVKILDEHEWNDLVKSNPRFAHVDDSNLGFADRRSGQGYVREEFLKTFPGAKSYLLQHEFDHLVEDQPTDVDEHGICHKRGFLRNYGAILAAPFTGGASLFAGNEKQHPEIGNVGGTPNQIANAILGTVPKIAGGVLGGLGGPAGAAAGAGLGSAVGDVLTGGRPNFGQAALSAGVAGLGQGLTGGLSGKSFFPSAPLTTSPGLGGAGTAGAPPAGFGSTASRLTGQGGLTGSPLLRFGGPPTNVGALPALRSAGIPAPAGLSAVGPSTQATGIPTPFTGGGDSFFSFWNQGGGPAASGQSSGNQGLNLGQRVGLGLGATALGTGLAMFGNRSKQGQPPEIPELSQLPAVQRFHTETQNRLGPLVEQLGGLTPQLQGFQSQLAGLANTPLPENLRASIVRPFSQELRDYYSQLAQYQPGADLATNSTYLRGVGDINQREAEALANAQLAFQGQQRQTIAQQQQGVEQQRQAILSQAGLTQEQLASYHELAQLDIDTIMARTGLRAEQANQFKQIFGNLGGAVAGAGIMGAFGGF